MIVAVVQAILLTLIGAYAIYTFFAHLFTWWYFARRDPSNLSTEWEPPVSIIKPTKGVDQSALVNFRSFCEQTYSSEYEILFCVEEPADPSVPVINRIIEEYPDRNIRLIFSDPKDTRSFGKLKNMIAGFRESTYDVVIFSDSDARVPPSFLRETVTSVSSPKIGISFGAPAYQGSENWAAALTSVSVNAFVLRLAPLCLMKLFDGAVGTTMVTRREVIEQIGGLEQLGWQIADDIQLARIIHTYGYDIHLLKQPARVSHRRDSFRAWWSHVHRWLVIIRHYLPVHFWLMSLMDLNLWWALIYFLIALVQHRNIAVAAGLVLLVLSIAWLSTVVVNLRFARNAALWRFLWVVPIQEFLRLPLLIHSCLTSEIVWRGRKLRINSDCTIRIVEPLTVAHERS